MSLLEKACSGKNANACYYLSGMYIVGVKKDNPLEDAKFGGPKKVEYEIPKDMQKAFLYAQEGCNLGNMYSCSNLSQMYSKGDGVEKNPEMAEKYKQLAIEMQKELKSSQSLTFQEGLAPT